MRKSRSTEEQSIKVLKEHIAVLSASDADDDTGGRSTPIVPIWKFSAVNPAVWPIRQSRARDRYPERAEIHVSTLAKSASSGSRRRVEPGPRSGRAQASKRKLA